MSAAPNSVTPTSIAAAEPVAVLALVRAALYSFLISRNIDAPTVAALCGVFELILTYVTRLLVTPVKRAEERVAHALQQEPPGAGGAASDDNRRVAVAAGSIPASTVPQNTP